MRPPVKLPDTRRLTRGLNVVFQSTAKNRITVVGRQMHSCASTFPLEIVTCRFDDDCPAVSVPGGSRVCGQFLYDIGHRRPGNRQPAKIPQTPAAYMAGVCNAPGDSSDGVQCSAPLGSKCPNAAPCVLFRAELGFIIP